MKAAALVALATLAVFTGCRLEAATTAGPSPTATTDGLSADEDSVLRGKLAQYTTVRLSTNLTELPDSVRLMIPYLIEAARAMDEVFWVQAYGNRDSLLTGLDSEAARRYVTINYGPWDRIDGNAPFLSTYGVKPLGANFYPANLTREALLETADLYPERDLTSRTTLVRRVNGQLIGVPYHEAFAPQLQRAAAYLRRAADFAQDPGLQRYLRLRADALLTDDYQASDLAWMDMRDNPLDIIIGPIDTYEDDLAGYKSSVSAFVMVKDTAWSQRLKRYAQLLPELQRGLPVDSVYKAEQPGTDADLGAFDVVFAAGGANAGPKVIAINMPADPLVEREKGSRRLQLKNVMRAKFDRILVPIADVLIAPDQRENVTFEAFFGNTMFHEVAHGLGIRTTVSGSGTVSAALRDRATTLEEGKSDVLAIYLAESLIERGEWSEASLLGHQVTSVASIFRSIRFGAASAHGRANLIRFNIFRELGAIVEDSTAEGTVWRVVPERVSAAADSLSARILTLQGDGDYDAVDAFVREYGRMTPELQASLDRVAAAGIPVDIVFEQGVEVLGLAPAPELDTAADETVRG